MASDQTTNLQLSLIAAAQAQKHVPVNESLRRLDALVQLSVVSATTTAQPASPADGAVYILPSGKTGDAWGAMANGALAYYRDGVWEQITPREGWVAFVKDADIALIYSGAAWVGFASILSAAELLARVLTVDGAGSLLDADTVDGLQAAAFAQLSTANTFTGQNIFSTVNTFNLRILISGAGPELRFEETDQTSPSGQWRFIGSLGNLSLQKGTGASFSAQFTPLRFDQTDSMNVFVNAIFSKWVRIGSTADSAATAGAGAVRWDAAMTKLQVSDGTNWINLH